MEFEWDPAKAIRGDENSEIIRLISASKADSHEQAQYREIELDPKNPTPLSAAQRRRLAALAARQDSEIDYGDIPKQTAKMKWSRPGALVPAENKQQITLRLDAEVLSFFKSTGARIRVALTRCCGSM